MNVKRKPVEPITPAQAALLDQGIVPAPTTWEEGDEQVITLLEKIVADQQAAIEILSDAVVDARGLVAAVCRTNTDLIARFDALDLVMNAQADALGRVGPVLAGTVDALVEEVEALTKENSKVHDSVLRVVEVAKEDREDFAKIAGEINETVAMVNGAVSKLADLVEAQGTAISKGGELLTELRGEVETIARATDKVVADAVEPINTRLNEQIDEVRIMVDSQAKHVVEQIDQIADKVEEVRRQTQANAFAISETDARVKSNGEVTQSATDDVRDLINVQSKKIVEINERIEHVAGDVTATRKAIVEQGTAATEAIDDLAKTASSEDAGLALAIEAVGKRIDIVFEAATNVGDALKTRIDQTDDAARLSVNRVDELVERVEDQRERLDEISGSVKAVVQSGVETKAQLGDLGGRLDAQAKTVFDLNDNIRAIDGEVKATARAQGEDGRRIAAVEEGVVGFVSMVKNAGVEIAQIDQKVDAAVASVEAMHTQARDALARVTILTDQGPAGFHIDRDGHLIRTARNGEAVDMGRIVAETRDGVDAAKIVAAKIEDGRLIIVMSDASSVTCSVAGLLAQGVVHAPAPARTTPDIDPTVMGYLSKDTQVRAVQVEDMTAMRKAAKSYKQIAAKYNVSERQAARLIKEGSK